MIHTSLVHTGLILAGPVLASTTTTPGSIDPNDTSGDVGTAGPTGLAVIVLLLIAAALLVKSMSRHLKRIPASFDPEDQLPQIPDTPEELLGRPQGPAPKEPGQDVLDQLRRAPRAIEPPRRSDGRPDTPPAGA